MAGHRSIDLWAVFFLALALIGFAYTGSGSFWPKSGARGASTFRPEPPAKFYSKRLDCGGIMVRAHHDVSDRALQMACGKIEMMLWRVPNVRASLVSAGVEMHIIGSKQKITDLPEDEIYKGQRAENGEAFDEVRGLGGVYVACSEENLLELKEDPYYPMNEDVCVHEFAHAIQGEGLPDDVRQQIEERYHRALAEDLWSDAYAATNPQEFFAEMSTWYFGADGDPPKRGLRPWNGTLGLTRYDPETYALLDDIYQGRLAISELSYENAGQLAPDSLARSKDCTRTSLLIFANPTAANYNLYWINPQAKREAREQIPPYDRVSVDTCVGHPWLVSDERDHPLSIFVPETARSMAVLSPRVFNHASWLLALAPD